MTAYEMTRLLTSLRGRCCRLSAVASALASVLIVLASLSLTQGNPLVYPNRFSFQKTSTTSTTQVPMHDHDHSNKSISSLGSTIAESGLPTSYGSSFRFGVAALVIGAIVLVCLLYVILCPRKERRNDHLTTPSSSSCYVFPVNSNPKSDLDSTSIIASTNSDNLDSR